MNNNYFNPYAMGGQYTPNVNQSLNQLQNLLGQYQNMQQSNYRNQQVAMSNQGRWLYVNDYNDVLTYPTPQDGSAYLFVNLDKGLLWSKKFVDGQNSIQAFSIQPFNNIGELPQKEVEKEMPKEDNDLKIILDEITKLSERIGVLENGYKRPTNEKSTNKTTDAK